MVGRKLQEAAVRREDDCNEAMALLLHLVLLLSQLLLLLPELAESSWQGSRSQLLAFGCGRVLLKVLL